MLLEETALWTVFIYIQLRIRKMMPKKTAETNDDKAGSMQTFLRRSDNLTLNAMDIM